MKFDARAEAPRMIAALSKVYGEPYEPDDPLNQEPDFQLGYARGLLGERGDRMQGITDEWIRRGKPADDSFRNWKRGYWAGRFTAVANLDDAQQ